MKDKSKGVIVSFRISESDLAAFEVEMKRLGLRRSKYFSLLVTGLLGESVASGRDTPDYKRCLFYLNKTSNNINQIAKKLNTENKAGNIDYATFIKTLNVLISIQATLSGALE
ncbi:MAG: plasmid mobilization relaxosome protein MobC [Aeromonas sp.]